MNRICDVEICRLRSGEGAGNLIKIMRYQETKKYLWWLAKTSTTLPQLSIAAQ
jgi:hypothetical protein